MMFFGFGVLLFFDFVMGVIGFSLIIDCRMVVVVLVLYFIFLRF